MTTEIFHEHNFIYRRGQTLDTGRYSGRGPFGRALGWLTRHPDTRSLQLVQIHKLRRDIRALRPDVVVGWGHEMAMLSFVAAALERVPHIVFCIRTFDPGRGWTAAWMAELLERSHRRMFPLLSGVIVNSTLLRDDYSSWLGVSADKISVCPNGIDAPDLGADERMRLRAEVRHGNGIPDEAVVLAHVGRFSAEKGQRTIIQANKILLERRPSRSFFWLLLGDGPLLADIRASAAEMDNVIFLGRSEAVESALCAADIFVMPSDFEGMPNAMMEAMSMGLPCVSTRLSGARDVARENLEALYCEIRAPAELAEKVAHLLDHPEERRRIGEAAERRMKEFTVPRMNAAFDDILDALARSKKRRRRARGAR